MILCGNADIVTVLKTVSVAIRVKPVPNSP